MCVEEHKFNETSKPKMDKPYCSERNILQQTLKYAILFPSYLRVFNTSICKPLKQAFDKGLKFTISSWLIIWCIGSISTLTLGHNSNEESFTERQRHEQI